MLLIGRTQQEEKVAWPWTGQLAFVRILVVDCQFGIC